MGGLEIDGGVSDHQRFERRGLRRLRDREQSRRIRFPAGRRIAADHLKEPVRQLETLEDLCARALRLVRQHGQGEAVRPQFVERFRNAGVRLRMNGQALFVMREEAVERAGGVLPKRRRHQGAPYQHRGAVANHRGHGIEIERSGAELDEQGIDRIGQIPARVDEGAVEVEDDEPDRHYRDSIRPADRSRDSRPPMSWTDDPSLTVTSSGSLMPAPES